MLQKVNYVPSAQLLRPPCPVYKKENVKENEEVKTENVGRIRLVSACLQAAGHGAGERWDSVEREESERG